MALAIATLTITLLVGVGIGILIGRAIEMRIQRITITENVVDAFTEAANKFHCPTKESVKRDLYTLTLGEGFEIMRGLINDVGGMPEATDYADVSTHEDLSNGFRRMLDVLSGKEKLVYFSDEEASKAEDPTGLL